MTLPRKWPVNSQILKRIKKTIQPGEGQKYLINRNPRNLEFLRIARKPEGYQLDIRGRCFWNKLDLSVTGKYVTAKMVHFENGPVIEASTSEWAIKKQLFSTTDRSAYLNLGKIFAQRCLESGFIEMACSLKPSEGSKAAGFIKVVEESGIVLSEPPTIIPQLETNAYVGRKEKPYGDWEEH